MFVFKDKLKKIRINVSEKIDQFVFADILKLSVKMKKKRKRVKKKKVRSIASKHKYFLLIKISLFLEISLLCFFI